MRTQDEPSTPGLIERRAEIRAGQCFNKSPLEYGAFPTDPYSHSPAGEGAKQPGMTGMVKEEILARQAELGFTVVEGCIAFDFLLFDRNELTETPSTFTFHSTKGDLGRIELPVGSLAYTICQVPVIYTAATDAAIHAYMNNGQVQKIDGTILDSATSRHIFERDGVVHHLIVFISENINNVR